MIGAAWKKLLCRIFGHQWMERTISMDGTDYTICWRCDEERTF